MASQLIPLRDAALRAARPDWPYSAWATGHMIRTGRCGAVRIGRRVFVTPELLDACIAQHTVEAGAMRAITANPSPTVAPATTGGAP